MFLFHAAFSLGMIALTSGTALYAWSALRPEGLGVGFAKFIAKLVIIFSITSTICTVYYGIKYWQAGYFQSPMAMMQMEPKKSTMQDDMGGMQNEMMNQQKT